MWCWPIMYSTEFTNYKEKVRDLHILVLGFVFFFLIMCFSRMNEQIICSMKMQKWIRKGKCMNGLVLAIGLVWITTVSPCTRRIQAVDCASGGEVTSVLILLSLLCTSQDGPLYTVLSSYKLHSGPSSTWVRWRSKRGNDVFGWSLRDTQWLLFGE